MIVGSGADMSTGSSYVNMTLGAEFDPKVDVNAAHSGAVGGALSVGNSEALTAMAGADTIAGKCGAVITALNVDSSLLTL